MVPSLAKYLSYFLHVLILRFLGRIMKLHGVLTWKGIPMLFGYINFYGLFLLPLNISKDATICALKSYYLCEGRLWWFSIHSYCAKGCEICFWGSHCFVGFRRYATMCDGNPQHATFNLKFTRAIWRMRGLLTFFWANVMESLFWW